MKYRFLLFLLFFFSFNGVLSLGVSPGVVEIDFEPNLQTSFEMTVINYPLEEQVAEIYPYFITLDSEVIEEFEDIIDLETITMPFTKEESRKSLTVNFNFPEGFSKGGVHELRIGVRPYVEPSQGGLVFRTGNEIKVLINVPEQYVDEKYKVIKDVKIIGINAEIVNQGEIADIEVKIRSESEVVLSDVYAVVKVLNKGVEIGKLETNRISIEPGGEKTLNTKFNTGKLSGNLILNVEVFYGSDSTKGNGILNIIGEKSGGFTVEKKKFSINWWWIIIGIIIFLLLLIILLMFILLMKKRNENESSKRRKKR